MISFSAEEVGIIGVLLSAVIGALSLVFRLLIKEKDRQITRLEYQLDQRLDVKITVDRIDTRIEEIHSHTFLPSLQEPRQR